VPEKREIKREVMRTNILPKPLYWTLILFTTIGIGFAVVALFGFTPFGRVLPEMVYLYIVMGLFMPLAFLVQPGRKKDRGRIPWYDIVFAVLAFAIPIYLAQFVRFVIDTGVMPVPLRLLIPVSVFLVLCIETGRRIAGNIYVFVCLIVGLYPLVADADWMPDFLYGFSFNLPGLLSRVGFGSDGILGVPAHVMGNILIGFLLFAGFMIASGAGKFFLDMALALAGHYRGGAAKVAVVSSAFFGSLSGSTMTNVVSTGSVTIPAMKRLGISSHYAGAIETVASTGGHIVPPVMGGVVYVMVIYLQIDLADVIVAAVIPAVLYYFSLMIGVDAYAAKNNISGIPREELPSARVTFRTGWPFLAALVFLTLGLVYFRWGYRAPFYASGLLVLLSFTSRQTMMTPRRMISAIANVGQLVAQAFAIIIPMGFIINGLVTTGMTSSLTASVVALGGNNVIIVMVIGFLACYIMGMAGLISAAYIFLAVSMAPAVIAVANLNEIAVHFFIVYYTMLGPYTLPVAGAAFIAAMIADAPPIKTAWTSMRLGIATYFIPFFFAFNPAFVLQGDKLWQLSFLLPLALVGIFFVASGTEGYMLILGRLTVWIAIPIVIGGILIAFPEVQSSIIGAGIVLIALVAQIVLRRRAKGKGTSIPPPSS
jgi:TRAP transporter 4TM/12TM fusion protein